MKQFKTIEPLSNFDIIELCNNLKIKNFKGCFMRDELSSMQRSKNKTFILNLDDNAGPGTHWTCLCLKTIKHFILTHLVCLQLFYLRNILMEFQHLIVLSLFNLLIRLSAVIFVYIFFLDVVKGLISLKFY